MSTGTESCAVTAKPTWSAAFVGKYAMSLAGDDGRHTMFLTAGQAWEKYSSAKSYGTLSSSEEDPGQGFSFVLAPDSGEGPGQLCEVVMFDDWLAKMIRQPFDSTTETLVRVLERARRL